jgi:CRISPR-associated protein Cmr2
MDRYLVTLSLGPVQSLIEAARRTRDLWCGSWLLSEAAKAAALSLHGAQNGCLVFPYIADPENELAPAHDSRDMANISNIIRARIEAEAPAEVARLCGQAQDAAAKHLAACCVAARNKVPDLGLHDDLWNEQVGDILESYAAWTALEEGEKYGDASARSRSPSKSSPTC